MEKALIDIDLLDELSNSVIDLIKNKEFGKAKSVCDELKEKYPDQIDWIDRWAMLYEAR